MPAAKKLTTKKPIMDVAHPGKSAPDTTSKPVIVTNRPILKDPVVGAEPKADETEAAAQTVTVRTSTKPKLTPLSEQHRPEAEIAPEAAATAETAPEKQNLTPGEAPTDEKPKTEEKPVEQTAEPEGNAADIAPTVASREGDTVKDPAKEEEELEKEAAAKTAALQQLVDSKQYYLPINTMEKRRTKRVVIAGLAVSVVLALAWVNIALDAGLISIPGVQPVTSFFSS